MQELRLNPSSRTPEQQCAGTCLTTGFPGGRALLHLLISMVYIPLLWPRSSYPRGTTEPRAGKRWATAHLHIIFPPYRYHRHNYKSIDNSEGSKTRSGEFWVPITFVFNRFVSHRIFNSDFSNQLPKFLKTWKLALTCWCPPAQAPLIQGCYVTEENGMKEDTTTIVKGSYVEGQWVSPMCKTRFKITSRTRQTQLSKDRIDFLSRYQVTYQRNPSKH